MSYQGYFLEYFTYNYEEYMDFIKRNLKNNYYIRKAILQSDYHIIKEFYLENIKDFTSEDKDMINEYLNKTLEKILNKK